MCTRACRQSSHLIWARHIVCDSPSFRPVSRTYTRSLWPLSAHRPRQRYHRPRKHGEDCSHRIRSGSVCHDACVGDAVEDGTFLPARLRAWASPRLRSLSLTVQMPTMEAATVARQPPGDAARRRACFRLRLFICFYGFILFSSPTVASACLRCAARCGSAQSRHRTTLLCPDTHLYADSMHL